ncbi:MAG TPA: hypothetical protein VGI19_14485 [Candidatus Cybelea sp.]
MICARCNDLRSGTGKCSTCGTRLQSLASAKRRGWVALGAGVCLVAFIGAIWVWLHRLFASQGVSSDATSAKFLGRMDVALALVVVAGALGVVNGWLMAQTGRRNRLLIYALIGVFAAAVFVAASATR